MSAQSATVRQQYDFVHDINVLIALVLAYAFVPIVFMAIGAPRKGAERVAELLMSIRRRRNGITRRSTREQRLNCATQMYDEFQRLQAVTADPKHRARAVDLLLSTSQFGGLPV